MVQRSDRVAIVRFEIFEWLHHSRHMTEVPNLHLVIRRSSNHPVSLVIDAYCLYCFGMTLKCYLVGYR